MLFILLIAKKLSLFGTWGSQMAFLISVGYQIYLPLWVIKKEGTPSFHPNLKTSPPSPHNIISKNELFFLAKLYLSTFILYGASFAGWQFLKASLNAHAFYFSFSLPPQLVLLMFSNLFLVAFPEEFFYRGFMQTRLLKLFPNRTSLLGWPIGWAIMLVNLFFALGHLVGETNPWRLATFFPGIIFSGLVFRYKSILSAIIYHTFCNVYSEILAHSFR